MTSVILCRNRYRNSLISTIKIYLNSVAFCGAYYVHLVFYLAPETKLKKGESWRSVMAKVLDCSLEVGKFEYQPLYYVYFRTNTLRKGMNSLIFLSMG